jgi:hypothetical protein
MKKHCLLILFVSTFLQINCQGIDEIKQQEYNAKIDSIIQNTKPQKNVADYYKYISKAKDCILENKIQKAA